MVIEVNDMISCQCVTMIWHLVAKKHRHTRKPNDTPFEVSLSHTHVFEHTHWRRLCGASWTLDHRFHLPLLRHVLVIHTFDKTMAQMGPRIFHNTPDEPQPYILDHHSTRVGSRPSPIRPNTHNIRRPFRALSYCSYVLFMWWWGCWTHIYDGWYCETFINCD